MKVKTHLPLGKVDPGLPATEARLDVSDTIAVVAPHDRLAEAVRPRYDGICTRVEFSIPVKSPKSSEMLHDMVRTIQQPRS